MMKQLSVEEYKLHPKQGFIFFFSMDSYCGLCRQYNEILNKRDIPQLIKVNSETEEELMEINIPALPCTVIFDENGKPKFQEFGILYDIQIDKMLKFFHGN